MAYALTQEQVLCIICMDSFTNPVSIPCGHNFCLECINGFLDTSHKSECPLCKENFRNRPALRAKLKIVQAEIQQMIQTWLKKTEDIKNSMELSRIGDKTDLNLGVAKESINRSPLTVRPDNGYWAICRRKGESLRACAGPSVTLNLHEIPMKVGVFLDYEDGSVSFYNADAKTHIYTYKGCSFTEPLYPYFNPCLHDNGRNTAPLIICPVETGLTIETAGQ